MSRQGNRAVILLSGGLDSVTCLAIAKDEGYDLCALSFRYGQQHLRELDMARLVAAHFEVERHIVVDFDMRTIGGSALTGTGAVPKDQAVNGSGQGIPATYVPARNTIFLSFALAWAEVLEARDIFIGVNAIDYSGYPDCRPEFIEAFEHLANLATKAGIQGDRRFKIRTPLLKLTKAQIIRSGTELGVDYGLTLSCYDPNDKGFACGHCDSCLFRKKGFAEAGIPDPTTYTHY